ncbi:MAG: phage holin family protein [Microcella sp.]|nr:phage holin family protein [Microcella sp.]
MTTPEGTTRERRGFFSMIADIPGLIRELIAAEIESLKAEVIGKMKAAGIGAGFLVAAATFAFFATLVLTAAGILALALVLPAWAAALIVGGALLVLAGIAAAVGIAQLKHGVPPTPTDTIESVKEDVRVVRGIRKRDSS